MRAPHPSLAGAVILGGAHGSLAVVRSLGRQGIPVWFVTNDHPIAKYSRYATRALTWNGPDAEGAVDWLIDLARQHGLDGWVLIAGGDAEVRLVAHHHAALQSMYRVITPPWETTRWASDKQLAYRHATSVGVASPWSRFPTDRSEIASVDCRFPVILKPRSNEKRNAFTAAKAWRAEDRTELISLYDEAAALVGADAVILQELIAGGGEAQFSYAGVWQDGAPIASLVARRRRQFPVDFGFTSTFVETIDKPEIEEAAERFLAPLRFTGLVEVEFKYDCRDGRYKLLDVNPRPWTWIGLGAAAGVDFPDIQWRLARGESVQRCRGRAGIGWTYVSRDIVSAVRQIANGTLSAGDYVRSLCRPLVFAAFAWDDPVPAVVDVPVVIGRILNRRLAEKREQQGKSSLPGAPDQPSIVRR